TQATGKTLAPEDLQSAVQGLSLAGQGLGLLWAAWGRWRATGPLSAGRGTGAGLGCLLLLLVLGLGLGAGGCAGDPMTVSTPALVPGAEGQLVPAKDDKGNIIMQTATVPPSAVPAWSQAEMAKHRHAYVEQTFDAEGRLTGQKIWGENGRAEYRDVDSDGVKYVKALAGPGIAAVTAGILTYGQIEQGKTMWGGIGALARWGSGSQQPTTVNVEGGSVYHQGNFSGGSFASQPVTTWPAPVVVVPGGAQ
ncbi:MAG: hypothetical protein V1806_04970, partial [Pseudomonadota bacterium]